MASSRVVPGLTLAVLVALLVIGSVVGWKSLTAPVAEEEGGTTETSAGTPAEGCAEVAAGETVRVGDVQVSVFNAGTRRGLAGQVQEDLVERGFQAGEVANAPAALRQVSSVAVYAGAADDPAALLVARHVGAQAPVAVSSDPLGPGVDVVVGDGYDQLATDAPAELVAEVAGGC